MSPDVLEKKLAAMTAYLNDLIPHRDISFDDFMRRHYEIERILELLIMTASDIVLHMIAAKGEPPPASYRASFLRAGELGIITSELSKSLAIGAGLRNILVHEYAEIDYGLLYKSIPIAIRDFSAFIKEFSK